MADVLVMFKDSDQVPMVVTEEHIERIQNCISGKVYWCRDEAEALEKGYDAEVLFLWGGSGSMPETYCSRSGKLKWVHSFSAGVNPIMDSSIQKLPVKLTNAKGIHGKTMALTTIGYMISFMRHTKVLLERQKKHIWSRQFERQPGEAEGMTVGIIGAGAIGSEVARLSKALGMKVLGVKRSAMPLQNFDGVYSSEELEAVLSQADFVVIATPLTDETKYMFRKRQFEIMKPTAVLINIARGAIVREQDLIEALRTGEIGGAALDTVENEPLAPDSPLWDMENVILTPHCAAVSELYMERAICLFCDNLKRYEAGRPLLNEIDMRQCY